MKASSNNYQPNPLKNEKHNKLQLQILENRLEHIKQNV